MGNSGCSGEGGGYLLDFNVPFFGWSGGGGGAGVVEGEEIVNIWILTSETTKQ